MSRLMSVSKTEQAVVERRKTVTRRLGWWEDKHGRRLLGPGDRLTLCRKVMGRRHVCDECEGSGVMEDLGEAERCPYCDGTGSQTDPLVRLAEVEVVSVRREPLWSIGYADVVAEAAHVGPCDRRFDSFVAVSEPSDIEPGTPTTSAWVRWFCAEMRCTPDTEVTRIEWRYLDA